MQPVHWETGRPPAKSNMRGDVTITTTRESRANHVLAGQEYLIAQLSTKYNRLQAVGVLIFKYSMGVKKVL